MTDRFQKEIEKEVAEYRLGDQTNRFQRVLQSDKYLFSPTEISSPRSMIAQDQTILKTVPRTSMGRLC